jgi:hypothetical protein
MLNLMKETNICSDDIIRTFISRRVLPLKRRAHKISEMYGPGYPTKITGLPLSKADVVLKANQICQTDMPDDWEWGFLPLSSLNPPTKEVRGYATRAVLPVTFMLRLTDFLFVFRLRTASLASSRIGEALAGSAPWTRSTQIPTSTGPI